MIPRNFQNTPVPRALCHDLAEDVSTSWKMLSRRLFIPEAVIRNIDSENHRVVEKCIAMFNEWKSRQCDNATVRVLREALEKIGRRDLSEKVRGIERDQCLYNIGESQPEPYSQFIFLSVLKLLHAEGQNAIQVEMNSTYCSLILKFLRLQTIMLSFIMKVRVQN